ncbi:MAG: hypothetical protein KA371_00580 [Acidobacteria bacterium]|nr:hypothetical protein [Acidobacteriota bacterium]
MLAACIVLWLGLLLSLPPRPSLWLVAVSGLPLLALASWRVARRRGRPWRAFIDETADLHALALVLLYAVGILLRDTHGITTDGVTYFAQLRSLVFDRDLDVAQEFTVLGQPPRPNHVVPIGPTLLWAPLYLAVAAGDGLGRLLGLWRAPSDATTLGLTLPYIRAALLSSFALGAGGLMAVLLHLRSQFSKGVAFATVTLLFGATPLFWYMVYEPSMTHAASFGFAALFAVASVTWLTPRGPATYEFRHGPGPATSPTVGRSLVLGTLLGGAFAVRSQEVLFALLPALLVLGVAAPWPNRLQRAVRLAGWAFLGALPWLLLQALHSYVLFARYEYNLLGQGGYFHPLQSRWLDTLFSSWHGFFSWTPVAYVAALGTLAYLRREWRWATAAIVVLFLTAWVNGATEDWAAGWSFGGRRFSSVLVLLAPGLALVIEAVAKRPLLALAPMVGAALWWNHLLMVQYTSGMLPKDEPVAFSRLVRQQGDVATRAPYAYPFAFPANAWFAWRHDLPIDKYDVLAPVAIGPSFETRFDRSVEKFLLEGWEAPTGDEWGSAWWIRDTPATLTVPLALPPGRVAITIRTRTRLDEPVVQAALALELNGTQVGQFAAGVPEPSTATLTVPGDVAARIVRIGFNHLSIRSLGISRVDPADPRPPGPLARRRDAAWPVAVYDLSITHLP